MRGVFGGIRGEGMEGWLIGFVELLMFMFAWGVIGRLVDGV